MSLDRTALAKLAHQASKSRCTTTTSKLGNSRSQSALVKGGGTGFRAPGTLGHVASAASSSPG
jgi:hypothetical protein